MYGIKITTSTRQCPSWKDKEDSQEILRILRNPKVHYRVHNSSPCVSIPSQIDPDLHPISWIFLLILHYHLPLCLPYFRFSLISACMHLSSPPYLPHASPISDFINHKIFGEYRSWNFSKCDLTQSAIISSFLGTKIINKFIIIYHHSNWLIWFSWNKSYKLFSKICQVKTAICYVYCQIFG